MDLNVLIEPSVNMERLAEVLDGLGHAGRLATVRGWGRHELVKLYEAAKGPMTLAHFVPDGVPEMTEVIHHGKNSLPLFSHFQKRFCKPQADATELWGYNHQSNAAFTGPGYFTLHDKVIPEMADWELGVDYRKLPTAKPGSWPPILPNSARLGSLVYEGMVDVMHGISKHVSIGRAWKKGKFMDAWFALCREDRALA